MAKKIAEARIGTSGWQYDHWKGVFYPQDVRKKDWFKHYSASFDTVEVNNTFYHLPKALTFEHWREAAPKGFCYTLKFSRYGSHIKRLTEPKDTIGLFLERAEILGNLLGPILVQLPPHWPADVQRLADFLKATPRRRRWALEFRDPSWLSEEVFAVLRRHNAALCVHDLIPDHPHEVTADWVYFRFHGAPAHDGNYSDAAMSAAAEEIRRHLAAGRDVYAYFNNDAHGYAVANAQTLRRFVTD